MTTRVEIANKGPDDVVVILVGHTAVAVGETPQPSTQGAMTVIEPEESVEFTVHAGQSLAVFEA